MAKILTLTLNPALDLTVQLPRLEAHPRRRQRRQRRASAG